MAAACTAVVVAVAGAASARGVAASRARANAERALSGAAKDYHTVLAHQTALTRIRTVLDQFAAFESDRVSATMLIGAFARALPDHTAMTALRTDSTGGTIVAIGPNAADLVIALDTLPEVTSPELLGPITQESVAGERLERVTVSFRFARMKQREPGPAQNR